MDRVYLIALVLAGLVLYCYVLLGFNSIYAGDFNDRDTATVEIWTRHDLGYEADTVRAIVHYKSGNQWYVRTISGECWSDREPKNLKEK